MCRLVRLQGLQHWPKLDRVVAVGVVAVGVVASV
jgi:hypothetical protein